MTEVLNLMRAKGYLTSIVTGGGQDFVRVYAEKVYGVPPEQVVGTAGWTKHEYGENGEPYLVKDPKLLLNDNNAGKAEGIHLMIGRQPYAAFGNSTGDRAGWSSASRTTGGASSHSSADACSAGSPLRDRNRRRVDRL